MSESEAGEQLSPLPRQLADGLSAGEWCPSGTPGDFPGDQARLDATWCSYTSPVLGNDLAILGGTTAHISLSCDQPAAEIIVRLCDVAANGASTLVARGVLNLRHRTSHEFPEDLVPGEAFQATLRLKATSYRFPAGHRIRVSFAAGYFPWAWPSPRPFALTLHEGAQSYISLPCMADQGTAVAFAEPAQSPPPPFEVTDAPDLSRSVVLDQISGACRLESHGKAPSVRLTGSGIKFGSERTNTFEVTGNDPLSARVVCSNSAFRRRGDWDVRVETRSEMRATETHFTVTTQVKAFEGGTLVHEADRRFEFPRR